MNSPGSPVELAGDVAGHFDVSAERKQGEAIVGIAAAPAEEPRAEADGKRFDANAAELGDGKVPEFVHDHHDAEEDGTHQNRKKMHTGLERPHGR